MLISSHRRSLATLTSAAALGAGALLLLPAGGRAAGGTTQTLRFFVKDVSMTLTRADGTVIRRPPSPEAPWPEARSGDTLDVDALGYAGSHRRHAARWTMSSHLRCVFADGAPACESHVAIGGSMLVFLGNPGTVSNGTGRYLGATGRVLSSREVAGGADVVARIRLRAAR